MDERWNLDCDCHGVQYSVVDSTFPVLAQPHQILDGAGNQGAAEKRRPEVHVYGRLEQKEK